MPGVFDPVPPAGPSDPGVVEPPAVETVAEDYYGRLGPLTAPDPENEYAVLALAEALTWPVRVLHGVVQASEALEPFAVALHPDTAPVEWLPWLAQPAGVRLRPGDTVLQQRARVKAAAGRYAGTDQAMKDEVALTLTSRDPGQVTVLHPSRWAMTVLTRTADTPDPAVSEAAAFEQVPAGTILTFVVSDAPIWAEATEDWAAVAATWAAATVGDVT